MKLVLNFSMLLLAFFSFSKESFSLTNYQIKRFCAKEKNLSLFGLLTFDDQLLSLTNYQLKQICKKEQKTSTCITNLREKRSNLQKGTKIEIPVIPYKGN